MDEVFPDLSEYSYKWGNGIRVGVLNVGWIDPSKPFPTWDAPSTFLDKLWLYCHTRAVLWWHMISCYKCFRKSEPGCIEKWKDGQLVLGCGEIRVFGKQETGRPS